MCGRVKGIDAVGNAVSWHGADLVLGEGINTLRWFNNEVSLFDDQPCLRSAPDQLTGEDRCWAIPTILVCTRNFGHRPKSGQSISLRRLYDIYKGVCQYCYEKIPYSAATKDHCLPKSKGGSNDDFNLVLACWECNNKKDSHFPYYDIHGKEVKPLKGINLHQIVPEGTVIREEWKPYLYQ
jgi:5-methylcytosine-specific restriction endonuclease McrA